MFFVISVLGQVFIQSCIFSHKMYFYLNGFEHNKTENPFLVVTVFLHVFGVPRMQGTLLALCFMHKHLILRGV